VTGDITDEYLKKLEATRSDKAKREREKWRRPQRNIDSDRAEGPTAGAA
jgi:hypothetical protein